MGKKDSGQIRETPAQKALATLAVQQLQDYRKRWLPVQRKLAEDVQRRGAGDSAARSLAKGQSSTDSAVRFGEARGGLEAALTETSGGAGSSKSKLAGIGLDTDEATSRGLGFVASDQAVDDAYMQGLGSLIAIGKGERAGATVGMQRVADQSGRQAAQDAELSAQRRAGNAQLIGQTVGLGAALYALKTRRPLYAGRGPGGVPGSNDFSGVNGGNATDQWLRSGSSGD